MRLIDCSNCFASCSDDFQHNSVSQMNRNGRFRALTSTIFNKTKIRKTQNNQNEKTTFKIVLQKFPIERKHKIKKRDLVKQLFAQTGNYILLLKIYRYICSSNLLVYVRGLF